MGHGVESFGVAVRVILHVLAQFGSDGVGKLQHILDCC